jgi:hypothetical protein
MLHDRVEETGKSPLKCGRACRLGLFVERQTLQRSTKCGECSHDLLDSSPVIFANKNRLS